MAKGKKIIRVAIIGAGVMGTLHARIYSKLPNAKLIAICDSNQPSADKLAKLYNIQQYVDYKELIKRESLDAVSITVPTRLHKEIAIFCIENGVNILVEKPIAGTADDARRIVKSAQKNEVVLEVGHIERFNPAIIKLRELIQKKVFGQIVSIAIKRVGLFQPRVKDVNVVTDLAVHDLDIVCMLLQKLPKSIYATGGKGINAHQVDYADTFLDFGDTSCYLQVNWMTPIKIRNLSVTGTLGYCELNYVTQELNLYKVNYTKDVPKEFKSFVEKLGKPQKIPVRIKKEEPLKLELSNFIDAITERKEPIVTGEDGILAVKLSEVVLKSLSQKRLLAVNFKS